LKDAQVSDLQQEKIRLANESLHHQRHYEQDLNNFKQQMEVLQENLSAEKEKTRVMKSEFEKKESNLSDEKVQVENEYAEVSSTLSMKLEDLSRLENLNKIKETELRLKDQV
jgi:uncharacterized membrane-anchored protein YhcB (DUF1043 family)